MKTSPAIPLMFLLLIPPLGSAFAQRNAFLGDNAALRYWAAFAQMQDSAVSDQQAKELNTILDGTAPYDDSKYKDLVDENKAALQTLHRATALPKCDWGLDYQLGEDVPVEYARKALALGRLNVLYAFHLLIAGDRDGAVGTLVAGIHFSQDVANGGSLFATLAAKSLIVTHLRAVAFALHTGGLSAVQRSVLQKAIARLEPNGLDWQSATKRDLESLSGRYSAGSATSVALTQIVSSYLSALSAPSELPSLKRVIENAPQPLPHIIPNPARVLEEKQDLSDKLMQMRSLLQ
jgi:hypothetical protein